MGHFFTVVVLSLTGVKIPEFSVLLSHIFLSLLANCFALQMPFPSPALCFFIFWLYAAYANVCLTLAFVFWVGF